MFFSDFDFNDVYQKGFGFDLLQGAFNFSDGRATTKDLFIEGASAKVLLNGDMILEGKELDLNVRVTPKMGTALPVAAAVAVNPIFGAAFWVFDKLAGTKMGEIAHYQYHLSGTWNEPVVKEMKRVRKKDS